MATINVILALMIIPCFLLTMLIHQYTQALTASLLGDPTPRSQGLQSFSLRVHLDPMGTLLSVITAFSPAAPMGLGWGKPIKTDPWKMRSGANTGTLLIAVSGIVTNLALGVIVALLMRFLLPTFIPIPNAFTERIIQLVTVFATTNLVFGFFNLLPLYPLDGYQVLYTLLPSQQALKFARSAQYGPLIILVLLFVLPFLGELSGTSGFFLFRLSAFLLQGVLALVSLISGQPAILIYTF
jgi:Zn-dependent protease